MSKHPVIEIAGMLYHAVGASMLSPEHVMAAMRRMAAIGPPSAQANPGDIAPVTATKSIDDFDDFAELQKRITTEVIGPSRTNWVCRKCDIRVVITDILAGTGYCEICQASRRKPDLPTSEPVAGVCPGCKRIKCLCKPCSLEAGVPFETNQTLNYYIRHFISQRQSRILSTTGSISYTHEEGDEALLGARLAIQFEIAEFFDEEMLRNLGSQETTL